MLRSHTEVGVVWYRRWVGSKAGWRIFDIMVGREGC
jgi:hypothetical protein